MKETRERAREELYSVLSPMEKKVLDLFMEGQSYAQIAKNLNKDEKSVDNAVARIKKKARRLHKRE